jgi:AraC family transcriptional regulator, melibiose operon regulatory protein
LKSAGFVMQRHVPEVMPAVHTHGHVEILLPINCHIAYLTQLGLNIAPANHLCVLWGQIPHRVTEIMGDGEVMIANLPLAELLSWSLPEVFLARFFAGQLVVSNNVEPLDPGHFGRWHADYVDKDLALIDVARIEIQLRLRRQSISGWRSGVARPIELASKGGRAASRVQTMIRFIAEHYRQPICVADVANAAGVSKGHAMSLFRIALETSINGYLTHLRLHHARTMLVNGDDKILNIALDSGFGSLSRFYEIFVRETGVTPKAYRQSQ